MAWEKIWSIAQPIIKLVAIILIGHIIIRYAVRLLGRALGKSRLDESLISFIAKSANLLLHVLVILSALGSIGISTTGIVAAFSAAVVAIGLALKDSLSNVAGGILLLLSPRFATGDFIEAGTDSGTVIAIDLLHTTVRTPDHKQVSIPNGVLINSHITNYSREETRRVDLTFPISYEADAEKAKAVIEKAVAAHPLVLSAPEKPMVRILGYGDSAVNVAIRSWCKTADYWTVYFDLTEGVRAAMEKEGISIPYNQLDVRIVKSEG